VSYRAVVFDLDGVLWDGEPLYQRATNLVLAPYGYAMSDEDTAQVIGHSVEASWTWIRARFGLAEPIEEIIPRYDATVMQLLLQPVQPLPGVQELIADLGRRAVPFGLASSSLRQWVEASLTGLGLRPAFGVVVTGSDVKNGKPAPDLYLLAAEGIGVPGEECIAIEDTPSGIAAAHAAGMLAVQVRSATTAFPPLAEADIILDSLLDFDLTLLQAPVS
jgi:HAD superfamily hydrolase (TIGR01509 family)